MVEREKQKTHSPSLVFFPLLSALSACFFFIKNNNNNNKNPTAAVNNNNNQQQQPQGYLAPFSGTEAQRDNGGALVEVRLDFKNAALAEEAAAALRKSTAGTGQLATAMGTRGVQTKGLNVLSTRVSHLFAEPKKAKTTIDASAKGGDISTPATPKVHHGAAIAAVFALFAITAALSGSVVYVLKRRSAAALAAAECPLAPSATTSEESEQGNASPRSNKSKVTEDGGALEAAAAAADADNAATNNGKNSRRRGAAATSAVPFGSSTSSDESGGDGTAEETRPLSAGLRGARGSSARGGASRKAPAPASHRLSVDEAV